MHALLKYVGEKYWPWPQDHIKEVRERGPSIRVAPQFVPDFPPPYPIIFIHPRGSFHTATIHDLFLEMDNEGHLPATVLVEDYIVQGLPTLRFIDALSKLDKAELKRLEGKYHIRWVPAVTHYSYITSAQVVIGADGKGLEAVKELEARGVNVEPVQVIREEE